MAINHIISAILAAKSVGQGSVNAIRGWHLAALRALAICEHGLLMCLGYRLALVPKRLAAATTSIAATCWTNSDRRDQRHQRWMSGVVVDPGTVGVV